MVCGYSRRTEVHRTYTKRTESHPHRTHLSKLTQTYEPSDLSNPPPLEQITNTGTPSVSFSSCDVFRAALTYSACRWSSSACWLLYLHCAISSVERCWVGNLGGTVHLTQHNLLPIDGALYNVANTCLLLFLGVPRDSEEYLLQLRKYNRVSFSAHIWAMSSVGIPERSRHTRSIFPAAGVSIATVCTSAMFRLGVVDELCRTPEVMPGLERFCAWPCGWRCAYSEVFVPQLRKCHVDPAFALWGNCS